MANTATAQSALPVSIAGSEGITPIVVAIGTIDTDLTIFTPDSGKVACIVGMFMSETSATNITFKSGSTSYAVPELAANQGILFPVGQGILICGQPGEALKIQSSVAITSMLLYVTQATRLQF